MTLNRPIDEKVAEVITRLSAVEKAQKESEKAATDRNTETQRELVRLDEGLKGVRAQAKAHNDTTAKAISDIKSQMADDRRSLEKLLADGAKELYEVVDRISTALGLNDSKEAAGNLRDNLKTLATSIKSDASNRLWLQRVVIVTIITLAGTAIGTILVLGAKSFFSN